jgi:hypothetical protein
MIGDSTSEREAAFDHIETVHSCGRAWHAPFLSKVARIAQGTGLAGEKICLKRQDHVSALKMIARGNVLPKGQACPGLHGMIGDRFILVPGGGGKPRE